MGTQYALALYVALALAAPGLPLFAETAPADAASPPPAAGAEMPAKAATIRLVRVIIGDAVYEWREGEAIPRGPGDDSTHPATVLSFTTLRPGATLSDASLAREARAAERRLGESGFFYTASVLVVPSRSRPDARNVIITVTEGFRWRFGGGSVFAMAGQDNAGGMRRSWRAFAGATLAGASWTDGLAFGLPLALEAGAFYEGSLGDVPLRYARGTFDLGAFWRPHPDLGAGVSADLRYGTITPNADYAAWYPAASGWEAAGSLAFAASFAESFRSADASAAEAARGASQAFSLRSAIEGDAGLIAAFGASSAEPVLKAEASASLVAGWPFLSLGVKGSAGWSGASLPYARRFDIACAPDASVRSPVAASQAKPDGFVLVNAELRGPALAFFIPPFLNARLGLFLYGDLCFASRPSLDEALLALALRAGAAPENPGNTYRLEAFGVGLRAGFANPVNVYFTFTFGANARGDTSFGIVASNGF